LPIVGTGTGEAPPLALELPAGTTTSVGIVTRFGLLKTSFETLTVTGLAATLFSRTVPVETEKNATFVGLTETLASTVADALVAPPPPPPLPLPLPLPLDASVAAGTARSAIASASTIPHVLRVSDPFLEFRSAGSRSRADRPAGIWS
jgi:hypothetical protein